MGYTKRNWELTYVSMLLKVCMEIVRLNIQLSKQMKSYGLDLISPLTTVEKTKTKVNDCIWAHNLQRNWDGKNM